MQLSFSCNFPFLGKPWDKSSPSRPLVRDCSNEEDMTGGYMGGQFSVDNGVLLIMMKKRDEYI